MGDPLPLFIRCTLCPCGKRPAGKPSCFVRYRHFGCILWLFNGRSSAIRFGFFCLALYSAFSTDRPQSVQNFAADKNFIIRNLKLLPFGSVSNFLQNSRFYSRLKDFRFKNLARLLCSSFKKLQSASSMRPYQNRFKSLLNQNRVFRIRSPG